MITIIAETVWFFLPALTANMAPVFVTRFNMLPVLNVPVDGSVKWHNQEVLGPNKTVRGFLSGIVVGGITGYVQHLLYMNEMVQSISLASYDEVFFSIMLGALLGITALVGDSVKSFFKRRRGITSGQSWIPFDQIDFVLGVAVVGFLLQILTIVHIIVALLVLGVSTYIVSVIGVALGYKKYI